MPDPIADELEIRNLIAKLARLADIGTMDEYITVFTEDAEMEIPGLPTRSGHEGLRAGSEKGRAAGAYGPGSNALHFLAASEVTIDGDHASAVTPFVLFKNIQAVPALGGAGRYRDQFRRTADGWKFSHRRLEIGG
jgi:hypothetical protein